MAEHWTEVEARTKLLRGGGYEQRSKPVWVGVCGCGWRGEERDFSHQAEDDANQHRIAEES